MTMTEQSKVLDDLLQRMKVTQTDFDQAFSKATSHTADLSSLQFDPIDIGVASGTVGVWRIRYRASDQGNHSLILKGVQHSYGEHGYLWRTTDDARSDPFDWEREPRAYSSRLLEISDAGSMRAPKYYGTLETPESLKGKRLGVFMEDVEGTPGSMMDLNDFAEVARQLGSMQGYHLLQEIAGHQPVRPWLAVDYTREYIQRVEKMMIDPDNAEAWEHPLLKPFLQPTADGKNLRQQTDELWERRYHFLELLESSPATTIVHNDLWFGQVLLKDDRVILMDLATIGNGPIGMDLGKFASEVIAKDMMDAASFEKVEALLFDNYCDGMAEQGVEVKNSLVRDLVHLGWSAGIAASESYRLGADWVPLVAGDARSQIVTQSWGDRDAETVFSFYADRSANVLRHAKQAEQLASKLASILGKPLSLDQIATPETISALAK